jgi:DNA-binding CsgD family transcriptional regulator
MQTQIELRHVPATNAWLQPVRLAANSSHQQLAGFWNELISGCSCIIAEYSDNRYHYLELASSATGPLAPKELALWHPILLGASLKVVAADTGCASSTVACSAIRCLKALGLDRTSREVPMLLVMMAHAGASLCSEATWTTKLEGSVIVSARRPDSALAGILSPAEMDVVRLRVDGLSHRRIADVRSTSERTIANQLASAYTKLGVSGRPELLATLVKGTWMRTSEQCIKPFTGFEIGHLSPQGRGA